MNLHLPIASVALLGITLAGNANAQTVSVGSAEFDGAITYVGSLTTAGTLSGAGATISQYYSDATAYVSASQTPYPQIQSASALAIYQIAVSGPANENVPLVFGVSSETTSGSGGGYAYTSAYVAPVGGPGPLFTPLAACSFVFYYCDGLASTASLPSSLTDASQSFTVTSDTDYLVYVIAQTYGQNTSYSASVDPNVSFAPTFNSTGYTLLYSPDVEAPPVPLPACAWLLLSGLGALGALVRNRKAA